jgi:prefoldin subunit 5
MDPEDQIEMLNKTIDDLNEQITVLVNALEEIKSIAKNTL